MTALGAKVAVTLDGAAVRAEVVTRRGEPAVLGLRLPDGRVVAVPEAAVLAAAPPAVRSVDLDHAVGLARAVVAGRSVPGMGVNAQLHQLAAALLALVAEDAA